MATKKKSTALAKRNNNAGLEKPMSKREGQALRAELVTLRDDIVSKLGALTTVMQENTRAHTEAPAPLFEYGIDVDRLRDHDVLLVSVSIQNNGLRELVLGQLTLTSEGLAIREMPDEYRADVELEGGAVWARGGEKIPDGLVLEFAWAFECPDGALGANITTCLRVLGVAPLIDEVEVKQYDNGRPPSRRKTPKLLTAGGDTGKLPDLTGKPSESLWRRDER